MTWFTRQISIPQGILVAGAIVVVLLTATITSIVQSESSKLETELITVEGIVEGVDADGSSVCIRQEQTAEPECYQAVNALVPAPIVGGRIRILYGSVPIDPDSTDLRAYRIVAFKILG